jgi:hypothetical protein
VANVYPVFLIKKTCFQQTNMSMEVGMFKLFGVVLVVMAVGLAVVPMFTDCQSQGKSISLANGKTVAMKCHWSGVAEIGIAFPLFAVATIMTFSRRKGNLRNLSILGVVLGAMAITFPAGLIGVCSSPTMTCVTAMKPSLLGMGGLAVGISMVGLILSRKQED